MARGSAPAYLVHGEPPSAGEAMADAWAESGFLVLEAEGDPPRAVWLRCLACEGADVHASAAQEHVEARCLELQAEAYRAERLIEAVDSL